MLKSVIQCLLSCAGVALSASAATAQSTSWVAPVDGDWLDGFNWTTGVPNMNTQAVIDATGSAYEVGVGNAMPISAGSLLLNSPDATLLHTFGELDLNNGLFELQSGTYRMVESTLRNATIVPGNGLFEIEPFAGPNTLDTITIQDGQLVLPSNSNPTLLYVENTLTGNNGSLFMGNDLAIYTETGLAISNLDITTEMVGSRPVALIALPGETVSFDSNSSFTSDNAFLRNVHNEGTISAVGLDIPLPVPDALTIEENFTNAGLVQVSNGGYLVFDTNNLTNNSDIIVTDESIIRFDTLLAGSTIGNLEISDSRLEFDTFSTANLDSMSLTRINSEVVVSGGWNNIGDSYELNASTGNFLLEGGAIIGGELAFADGAALEIGYGSNIIDGVQISGGTFKSDAFHRVELADGWQPLVTGLTLDGVRLGLGGTISLSDFSGFTLTNGSRLEAAGELDLGGGTLSPTQIGGNFAISGGEVFNGVLDFSSSPLVFEGAGGQSIEGTVRDATILGEVIVESGRAILTGNIGIDGVTFRNRSPESNALGMDFVNLDLTGTGFTIAEGDLVLRNGTDITNGLIELLPGAEISTSSNSTLTGTTIQFGPDARLAGGGILTDVTLTGTPILLGGRFSGAVDSSGIATFDAGLESSLGIRNQTTLSGEYVGIDSVASGNTSEVLLAPNSSMTLPDGSSIRGVAIDIRDNGANASLEIAGLVQATEPGEPIRLDVSTVDVPGTVEAIDGGTVFLGNPIGELNVSGEVRALNGGIVNVSGLFDPGEIGDQYHAPNGTIRFAGEIQNLGTTLTVDADIERFALGHREEARVFDGSIHVDPGSELFIEGRTFLFDVDVTGDVIAERDIRLESGSNIDGTLTVRNQVDAVAIDPDSTSPLETYSIRFEETTASSSSFVYLGHDRQVELGPDLSVTGSGGELVLFGPQSSFTINGDLRAEVGNLPLQIEAAQVTLGGNTTVENQGTLTIRDALNAQSDGDDAMVVVAGRFAFGEASKIDITGDLALEETADLRLTLSGLPAATLFEVSDSLTLGGSFLLDSGMMTSIMPGDSFTLIEAASIADTFDLVGSTRFSAFTPEISIQGSSVIVTLFASDAPTVGVASSGGGEYEATVRPVPAPSSLCIAVLTGIATVRRRR